PNPRHRPIRRTAPGAGGAVTRLEELSNRYGEHHRARRGREFVYGGPERAELFAQLVGRGRRVLDLGCRYGALTRPYVDGTEAGGVDVDREAPAEAAQTAIGAGVADAPE